MKYEIDGLDRLLRPRFPRKRLQWDADRIRSCSKGSSLAKNAYPRNFGKTPDEVLADESARPSDQDTAPAEPIYVKQVSSFSSSSTVVATGCTSIPRIHTKPSCSGLSFFGRSGNLPSN